VRHHRGSRRYQSKADEYHDDERDQYHRWQHRNHGTNEGQYARSAEVDDDAHLYWQRKQEDGYFQRAGRLEDRLEVRPCVL